MGLPFFFDFFICLPNEPSCQTNGSNDSTLTEITNSPRSFVARKGPKWEMINDSSAPFKRSLQIPLRGNRLSVD